MFSFEIDAADDCAPEEAPDDGLTNTTDLLQAISPFLSDVTRPDELPEEALDQITMLGGDSALCMLLEERVRFYLKICRRVEAGHLLSRERAMLIRILAKTGRSALLHRGYTDGYIRALQGLPTNDIVIQPDGWNSWFRYAEQGNVECLQSLMDTCAKSRATFTVRLKDDSSGYSFANVTALMIAAMLDYPEICLALLNQEACMVCTGKTTALMIASWCGSLKAARILVDKEKGMKKSRNWTALMEAAHNNNSELVELLAPYESGQKNASGWTAMMIGAVRGHLNVVRILVPYEKQMTNKRGDTAKMVAKQWRHYNIFDFLDDYE
ncbi:Hypothetical protein GLP15_5112 [Giardia lamblia P15]|uniref:Protein 21.1 n=1 Tax=Giardia intestinalis (strain P15) TaxID=658858 RepID=E1EYG9_GIAIA|nr:Hypothetical protein GLP15_5112 [Giardia lamblia P15]